MNQEQILGIIRHVLTFGGGLIVAKGYADEGTVTTVVGGVITIVGAIWSMWGKKKAT